MTMRVVKSSVLQVRVNGGLPSRYPITQANPTGSGSSTRETIPMAQNAPPRWQHPRLNTTPWSTSYAVKRKPLNPATAKKVRSM